MTPIKSSNLSSSHKTFKQLEMILNMNGLLTLLNGARIRPVETAMSPTGHIPGTTVYLNKLEYKLAADDSHKYSYDYDRCYPLLFHAFHSSVYYISQVGFLNQNPITVYRDMKGYGLKRNN